MPESVSQRLAAYRAEKETTKKREERNKRIWDLVTLAGLRRRIVRVVHLRKMNRLFMSNFLSELATDLY